MPRIKHVKKSQKDQGNCSRCGDALPKGSAYRWIKFRFGGKSKRCMKPGCAFRASDLTQSDKLSRLYGAQETAQDSLSALDTSAEDFDVEDVKQALQEAADEIREVGEEYQESADSIMEHFPNGSPTSEECEEKASQCEDWAGELESFEPDDFEFDEDDIDRDSFTPPEPDEELSNEQNAERVKEAKEEADEAHKEKVDEARSEARSEWSERVIEEAQGAIDECPF